jgi:cobalt/nickel transport system permease protein
MCAVSSAAIIFSVAKVKKDDLCEKKVPIIGVMGAFVFAAQMINFTIPGTGSSGHIGGGILLAAILGAYPALLSMTAVLIIQCLFFADGGLLALGSNIFNMGVIPCLIAYPLLFKPLVKPLVKKNLTSGRITAASITAVTAALQLGAFAVVIETLVSGITELPFAAFVILMQPIHLAIGIIEGVITSAVLCFVYKMRPEIMESSFERTAIKNNVPVKNVIAVLAVIALIAAGALSLFVSSHPDGLEWAIKNITGKTEIEKENIFLDGAAYIREKTAFLPDYNFPDAEEKSITAGTSIAGIVGGVFTFLLAGITVLIISVVKKKQNEKQNIRTVRA